MVTNHVSQFSILVASGYPQPSLLFPTESRIQHFVVQLEKER